MKEKLSQRLAGLRTELRSGRQMEAGLEDRLVPLRAPLLRIGGAIQVLEELPDHDAAIREAAPDAPGPAARAGSAGGAR